MAIPIPEKPSDTCAVSDPTCAEQPSAAPEQPTTTAEPSPAPETDQPEPPAGTEIRTTPIPIPGGTGKQQQCLASSEAAPQAGPSQQQQQFPDMRGLVRFLNNPEGAMAATDSTYLNTMYSTDSADLVLKSAMNSSGYY